MPRALPCPFFKHWSPTMAYVLGYWFADGNMYYQPGAGGYFVSIGSKDVEHLERIQGMVGMGSLARITGSDVFKLVICRKELYDDLLRLGGTERKSLTLAWPAPPPALLSDFARGYIDGDGSLGWHRPGRSVQPMISVAGTLDFLTGLTTAIQVATGIPMPTRYRQKGSVNTWTMSWYGVRAKCLAVWLYGGQPELYLARKERIAAAFAEWKPKVFDPSSTTAQMWELFQQYLP